MLPGMLSLLPWCSCATLNGLREVLLKIFVGQGKKYQGSTQVLLMGRMRMVIVHLCGWGLMLASKS